MTRFIDVELDLDDYDGYDDSNLNNCIDFDLIDIFT